MSINMYTCILHVKGNYDSKAMSIHNVIFTENFTTDIYCCIWIFSYLFTSCTFVWWKIRWTFQKKHLHTFHILSSSPEPLDQCQPNLALSPTGWWTTKFLQWRESCYLKRWNNKILFKKVFRCWYRVGTNEGICYLKRWNNY